MKLIIAGTRTLRIAPDLIIKELRDAGWAPTVVISGCAKGPDSDGEFWAWHLGIPIERHPADWKKHGRKAGPIRNRQMAELCDAALVFWDGQSRGTRNLLDELKRLGKPVRVVRKPP